MWVCQIYCFFVPFEGSLQGLKLGLQHVFCYMLYAISHLSLFVFLIIRASVLQNLKYKWRNLFESIFRHSDWYKFLWTFCSKFYWYIIYLPQISFRNYLLISEIVLLFTAKTTNALYWPISRETKSFLGLLTRGIISLH